MELKRKKLGKRISVMILTLALVLGSFYSLDYSQVAEPDSPAAHIAQYYTYVTYEPQ